MDDRNSNQTRSMEALEIGHSYKRVMEPSQIKNYLVPAVAVGALIFVVALLFGIGGNTPSSSTSASHADKDATLDPSLPAGADSSATGIQDTMPPADGADW